jgi:hypothetical protein
MGGVRYCANCEAIVHDGSASCLLCGADFATTPPLPEPPSFYRQQAELRQRQDEAEPSKALGVMAWIAQVFAGVWIFLFCVAPILLVIVGFVAVLFLR